MKNIALLIELQDGRLKPANLGMITAARGGEHRLLALLLEPPGDGVLDQLAEYGVDRIVKLGLKQPEWHPERWSRAVADGLDELHADTLFGLTTARGRDLLPRIAALLDAPLVMDCIQVDVARQIARTSQYSGKTIADIRLHGPRVVYGLRPKSQAAVPDPTHPEAVELRVPTPSDGGLEVLGQVPDTAGAQNLTEADVIVSGGRGMRGGEHFRLLEECARAIGDAAVGASRAAVDAGWAPYRMQVGQTGAKVTPKVYIACGISGSVQHFAGMKTAGMIIAVNTDRQAAIMNHCDYFAVADLFDVLPALTRRLTNDEGAG